MVYPIFLVRGRNKGSDIICDLLQKKKFLQQHVKTIFLQDINVAYQAQIKGVPALKNENGIIYGSQVVQFLESLASKNQEIKEAGLGGSDFIFLNEDNEVSFDTTQIKSEQDFIIPSNPIGNNDLDIEVARQKAMREAIDEELKNSQRRQ
jgi:hypothetical protein